MKLCKTCKLQKALSEFGRRASAKDGLAYSCRPCRSNATVEYQKKNKEKVNAKNRLWASSNRSKTRAYSLKWVHSNYAKVLLDNSTWRKNNKTRCREYVRSYQAAKINASPPWLTASHKAEIVEIYRNCPKGYEVDHIVPLQGKEVRGLHVPWNLQYLTVSENRSKYNKPPQ